MIVRARLHPEREFEFRTQTLYKVNFMKLAGKRALNKVSNVNVIYWIVIQNLLSNF